MNEMHTIYLRKRRISILIIGIRSFGSQEDLAVKHHRLMFTIKIKKNMALSKGKRKCYYHGIIHDIKVVDHRKRMQYYKMFYYPDHKGVTRFWAKITQFLKMSNLQYTIC